MVVPLFISNFHYVTKLDVGIYFLFMYYLFTKRTKDWVTGNKPKPMGLSAEEVNASAVRFFI